MTKQQHITAPASLIKQVGTGADTYGLIGKHVRIINDPMAEIPPVLRAIFNIPPAVIGAEGVVFHIAENGDTWVDFGDNEDIAPCGPEQLRVQGLGFAPEHPRDVGDMPLMFEVIGE